MNLENLTKNYDFSGKTIIITGGVGILSGEIACALVGCNRNVVIMDRDPSLADRLMERIETSRGQAIVIYGAVLKRDTLQEVATNVIDTFGHIDALINAAEDNHPDATTDPDHSFFDLPAESMHFLMDLNLMGTVYRVSCSEKLWLNNKEEMF